MTHESTNAYSGFEQGPIRPPSEAYSLLIRVTRNCPWNRCTFCPVYKQTRFSRRPVEHIKQDIDAVWQHVETLRQAADESGHIRESELNTRAGGVAREDWGAFVAAANWFVTGGLRSVFLQDADSLAIRPDHLVEILTHLRQRFPTVRRITSYARSRTVAARKPNDLHAIREAGLNRLHVGFESGSDQVLDMVCKGATREVHVAAGRKAKEAGFELSEYYMPGLGGVDLSETHARESAAALNEINPDFIRLRTLAIPPGVPLFDSYREGRFRKCSDIEVVRELVTFIENLNGVTSRIKSDHTLNLFLELRGRLPDDRDAMLEILNGFLNMEPQQQRLYQAGRRLGLIMCMREMQRPEKRALVEQTCRKMGISADNVDDIADELARRYI